MSKIHFYCLVKHMNGFLILFHMSFIDFPLCYYKNNTYHKMRLELFWIDFNSILKKFYSIFKLPYFIITDSYFVIQIGLNFFLVLNLLKFLNSQLRFIYLIIQFTYNKRIYYIADNIHEGNHCLIVITKLISNLNIYLILLNFVSKPTISLK